MCGATFLSPFGREESDIKNARSFDFCLNFTSLHILSAYLSVCLSIIQLQGKVIPADLNYSKGRKYEAWDAYGQSKQACLLYAKELAKRLEGTHITAVSVHPGKINTGLWK